MTEDPKTLEASAKNSRRRARSQHLLESLGLCVWVIATLIVSQLIIAFPVSWIAGENVDKPVWSAVYQFLSYSLSLVICIILPNFLYKKHKKPLSPAASTSRSELGLSGLPTFADIGLAPVAYIGYLLVAGFLTNLASSLFSWFDANQAQNIGYSVLTSVPERAIAFLAVVVIAPIAEEVIFRGWLYGKLKKKLPAIPAIALVSLAFALVHGQLNVGLAVFVLSCFLCAQREITGSIYSGILTHMIMNGVSFFVLFVLG